MPLGERLGKRVLVVCPTSRGFGFVMFEDPKTVVEWSHPEVQPPDQTEIVARIKALLDRHHPTVLVLESTADPERRRKDRVRTLLDAIAQAGKTRGITVETLPKHVVRRAFSRSAKITKQGIAKIVASQYRELAPRLPPPRRPWDSEDPRMSLFSAAALAIAFYIDEQ